VNTDPTLSDFVGTLENAHWPTDRTRERAATQLAEAVDSSEVVTAAAQRRRQKALNQRILPLCSEAQQLSARLGVSAPGLMNAAHYAIDAATPTRRHRDYDDATTRILKNALAINYTLEGLEEIARYYGSHAEGNMEIRREARDIARRLRSAMLRATKVAGNIRNR
jgi:hypothetical protein